MRRSSEVFLQDILDCIDKIVSFVPAAGNDFAADEKTLLAVVRLLEIMGEAVAGVTPEIRDTHPEVPWKNLRDLRNHVAHRYWDIDVAILWDVIQNELPPLRAQLAAILATLRTG